MPNHSMAVMTAQETADEWLPARMVLYNYTSGYEVTSEWNQMKFLQSLQSKMAVSRVSWLTKPVVNSIKR